MNKFWIVVYFLGVFNLNANASTFESLSLAWEDAAALGLSISLLDFELGTKQCEMVQRSRPNDLGETMIASFPVGNPSYAVIGHFGGGASESLGYATYYSTTQPTPSRIEVVVEARVFHNQATPIFFSIVKSTRDEILVRATQDGGVLAHAICTKP